MSLLINSFYKYKLNRKKLNSYFLVLILFIVIISILSFLQGAFLIANKDIWLTIFKKGEELNKRITWDIRLPRFLTFFLVGLSLGI